MNDLKITHHYQNQKFNNIHEFFWGFGSSFHTVYAVVPLFLKELGAPEVIATSSAGIFSIIISLPMLIIAALTRKIINTKNRHQSCIILFVAFIMGYVFTFSDILKTQILENLLYTFIAYALGLAFVFGLIFRTTNKSLESFGVGLLSIVSVLLQAELKNILENIPKF